MSVELDTISALADQAIQQLREKKLGEAVLTLTTLKAMADAWMLEFHKWEYIEQDYCNGATPESLALKYKVAAKAIRNKSTKHKWINPQKRERELKRAMRAKNKSGNRFRITCYMCEQDFIAQSGSAKICGTCQALEESRKHGGKPKSED